MKNCRVKSAISLFVSFFLVNIKSKTYRAAIIILASTLTVMFTIYNLNICQYFATINAKKSTKKSNILNAAS